MEIWEILKRETPTRVDEINIALQNCIDAIENTKNLLQSKSIKYWNMDKSSEVIELAQAINELVKMKEHIESIKCSDIDISQTTEELPINTTTMPVEEIEPEPDEEEIDDDEKYLVDPTIPYKLSEDLDFMNTKPCAFELQGTKYAVKDFKGILVKLCELLYRKNQRLFEKIAREHRIKCGENGKVMICFKQDKAASELDKDKCTLILSSDILIFTNTNNPTKVYAIRELLSLYHLSAFSVYLKWDKRIIKGQRPIGKLLNIDYDYSQEIVTQQKVKPEIAIGQLAYDFFKEYFKDTDKHYNMDNFLDKIWCERIFNIPCPVFKEFDTNANIKEQTMWKDKQYPCYNQNPKYKINGKIYLITNRWYPQNRDKLETWINEQDSTYLERVYSKENFNNEDAAEKMEESHCEKSDVEKRIGEYARDYFTVYFSSKDKQYDLRNFLNKYWCNEHLGICYPLLKEVDITKPIADQKNYNNEYARYWTKPILQINDKHYIMCSQWFKGFQEKLDRWIEEHEIVNIEQKQTEHDKSNCIYYDYKKNLCERVDNPLFNQPCTYVKSCRYYLEQEIYVISKQMMKNKYCPCCGLKAMNTMLEITYTKNHIPSLMVINRLAALRCESCNKNYINMNVFRTYTANKNLDDIGAKFIEFQ